MWEEDCMLCDICNKNEATVHYTEVINGVKNERHLCSECMKEMDNGLEGEFPFAKLIKGILSAHLASSQENTAALQLKCNKCGMTYQQFAKVGKFGCAECYSVFGPLILDNIKRIQGSSTHTGKKYKRADDNNDIAGLFEESSADKNNVPADKNIAILQNKLKKAVADENFEEAARLRDEIKGLKEVEKHA
jgi:protein arginine kinase activator